ncbi:MAG: endonuclease domain-containing protein [Caldilineaceae bacterium]|nr:endonuclease domain-containing protein [Caldilineaceae bacterium]HRJ43323.1 endonuclease domain-containing protein [Caldilineaceae bacterium]
MLNESSPELRQRAKELRRKMTPAERLLWQRVRDRQLEGLKIRRQHPIGRFIADFYCHEARLVIEIDGGIHDSQAGRDAARTEYLEQRGFRVLRIRNEAITANIEQVLAEIVAVCRS